MHDSQRYRDNAAASLLAAQEACQPYYRKLHLSMAASWLSLARQDEAIDNLFSSWDTAKPSRPSSVNHGLDDARRARSPRGFRDVPATHFGIRSCPFSNETLLIMDLVRRRPRGGYPISRLPDLLEERLTPPTEAAQNKRPRTAGPVLNKEGNGIIYLLHRVKFEATKKKSPGWLRTGA